MNMRFPQAESLINTQLLKTNCVVLPEKKAKQKCRTEYCSLTKLYWESKIARFYRLSVCRVRETQHINSLIQFTANTFWWQSRQQSKRTQGMRKYRRVEWSTLVDRWRALSNPLLLPLKPTASDLLRPSCTRGLDGL